MVKKILKWEIKNTGSEAVESIQLAADRDRE